MSFYQFRCSLTLSRKKDVSRQNRYFILARMWCFAAAGNVYLTTKNSTKQHDSRTQGYHTRNTNMLLFWDFAQMILNQRTSHPCTRQGIHQLNTAAQQLMLFYFGACCLSMGERKATGTHWFVLSPGQAGDTPARLILDRNRHSPG